MRKSHQNHTLLRLVARACGIATSYMNYQKKRTVISGEILCGMISAISGESVTPETDAPELRRLYKSIRFQAVKTILPATLVAWDGQLPKFWVWLREGTTSVTCSIEPETDGHRVEKILHIDPASPKRTINGENYIRVSLDWDSPIPYGYYSFHLDGGHGQTGQSFLIASPMQLGDLPKRWGAFAPTYALRGSNTQGVGGFAELLEAARCLKQHGGEFLATLPLLPLSYEGDEIEVSPYSPLSRLFWNEIFLDVTQLPGPYSGEVKTPPTLNGDKVDYRAVYRFKKSVLQKAANAFFQTYPDGDEAFQDYVAKNSHLREYADFRAQKHPDQDYDAMVRFHLYAQYACHLQLSRLREEGESGTAAALYLDYPVGVHPDGFDAKRLADLFLKNYEVGAPPDWTFISGQTWGFEPLHPKKLEQSRYWYLRDAFHHYFQYSKIIRIDHVMGLYRLFCVPQGMDAGKGTYVYYDLNAQFGVLCLEAWRHGATVLGEDLGVVPDNVRGAMDRHKIGRMWIGQNEFKANLKRCLATIQPAMIASLNTHDMFPFASYIKFADLETLYKMGILPGTKYPKFKMERERRIAGLRKSSSPLITATEGMAASNAQMVMVNMEDLWEETIPQNIPGTTTQHPNWRRRYPYTIAEWPSLPLFQETVEILNRHRMVRP